jgi:hypothetical protein
MDPIEVREERVATNTGPAPAQGVAPVEPVAPAGSASLVGSPAPVAAGAPVAASTASTNTYSSRVGVYPVGYRTIQLIWLIVGVVNIILALDFIFRAAGADTRTGFAHYIARLGGWLAAPFDGIFNTTVVNGTSVFKWADVLAVAIYSLAAWGVTKAVRIAATPKTGVSSV